MAAQINGQLEVGAPAALSFEPISIPDLRQRWLDHHEHVRRSSLQTIRRYRAATEHLLSSSSRSSARSGMRLTSGLGMPRSSSATFARPRWPPTATPRPGSGLLRDTGIKFILETCSSLFNYAQRNRHLSPYAENPFRMIEISRMPVEDFRPVVIFTEEQERKFLEACDDWQFPLFLTLLLTGMRPGELVHLLLPDDLDLETGWLHIRNKPQLGWQVKTRNERDIPLGARSGRGAAARGRRPGRQALSSVSDVSAMALSRVLTGVDLAALQRELASRLRRIEAEGPICPDAGRPPASLPVPSGVISERFDNDMIRKEFIDVTERIGMGHITAPKTLRHTFATILQDANVDPLIRNELMGHVPAGLPTPGAGLAMTAVYTHTRPETKRRQLEGAMALRPAIQVARERLYPVFSDETTSQPT